MRISNPARFFIWSYWGKQARDTGPDIGPNDDGDGWRQSQMGCVKETHGN